MGGRNRNGRRRVTPPPADRTVRLSELINVAVGRADVPELDLFPLAIVGDDGAVATRAQAARALWGVAQISRLFAVALPEDELLRLQSWIEDYWSRFAAEMIDVENFGSDQSGTEQAGR